MADQPAKKRFSIRFKLSTFLICFTLAAIVIRCIVMPEYQRTRTVEKLIADGHDVIMPLPAPQVTMFSGVSAPAIPVVDSEPKWYSIRRSLAKLMGVKTTPWNDELTVKLQGGTDIDVAIACQLKDLKTLHLFKGEFGDESDRHIGSAKNLKVLKLESAKISESTLKTVTEIPHRVVLHWISY